ALKQEARADQLRAAIVEKEQRQIRRYFGSKEGFGQAIHEFLMNYLGNENPNNQSNEGGSEYE
ncbi:viral A-type inclusion protein, partial [Enterococcus faecium]|nr:viral A-type inclusion protein [Enterococcus faecium]